MIGCSYPYVALTGVLVHINILVFTLWNRFQW